MSRARDRQEFGNALDQTQNDYLQPIHLGAIPLLESTVAKSQA
jgi:hypothetical protein